MAKKARSTGLTYARAGVSLGEADAFVEKLSRINPAIGGFSGAFPLDVRGMKKPVLLASTDGVGTKLLVAQEMNRHDSIGIDLVAMVVNDLIVCGARPLFFLDYYATGKLTAKESGALIKGIVSGCNEAGIPLIGGETAEMPGVYGPGHYDLAGFGVGVADSSKLIDGSRVRPGDVLIGVASNGVHSNGYSLVRAIVKKRKLSLKKKYPQLAKPLGEELLTPTRIYVRAVQRLMKSLTPTAMAHITGGGLPGNVVRVLPRGARAVIDAGSWPIPRIFAALQEWGGVEWEEMFDVFNMGIGFVIICRPGDVKKSLAALKKGGERAYVIGEVERGKTEVIIDC